MGTQVTWRGGARYKIEDEKTRTPHYGVRRATMRRAHHTTTCDVLPCDANITLRPLLCDVRRARTCDVLPCDVRRARKCARCEVRCAKRDVGTCSDAAASTRAARPAPAAPPALSGPPPSAATDGLCDLRQWLEPRSRLPGRRCMHLERRRSRQRCTFTMAMAPRCCSPWLLRWAGDQRAGRGDTRVSHAQRVLTQSWAHQLAIVYRQRDSLWLCRQ